MGISRSRELEIDAIGQRQCNYSWEPFSLSHKVLKAMASTAEQVPNMSGLESHVTVQKRAYYAPPWADVSIIGVAGSSGSGKSTISQAIVKKLNLPWVVILSLDSFYKSLTPEQSKLAFANEWDFDSPDVRRRNSFMS